MWQVIYTRVCCQFEVSALLPGYRHAVICSEERGRNEVCWAWERAERKSLFRQRETDGQGVTLRPGHLTATNGCTRFPVQANTSPSTSPSQNWWCRQKKKKKISDLPTLYLESDGLLPPLEMPFCHRWVSNWVWVCLIFRCFDTYGLHVGGVWHYSSFKYRILDCVTGSDFIMPHGKTAGDKSRERAPIIHHFSETKQGWDDRVLHKVGKTEAVRKLKVGCFESGGMSTPAPLPRDIVSLECCDAI